MISYADVVTSPAWQKRFMTDGMHSALRVPPHVRMFLDNGAFAIAKRGGVFSEEEYMAFVKAARPDWFPISRDEIPSPQMPSEQQRLCLQRTMRVNRRFAGVDAETLMYEPSSFVPIVHIGDLLQEGTSESELEKRAACVFEAPSELHKFSSTYSQTSAESGVSLDEGTKLSWSVT